MSPRESLSTVPEPNRSGGASDESDRAAVTRHPERRRTEKRFEIGFFVRKRVRGRIAFYRQVALSRTRRPGEPVAAPAPPPPPPGDPEAGAEGGAQRRVFAAHSSHAPGPDSGGGGADEPTVSPYGVLPDDEGGPIEQGTSYEIGAFASTTTETTADDE